MALQFDNVIANKFNAFKETTLKNHFVNSNSLTEDGLQNRFAKPAKTAHNVTLEFTTDAHHLEQYRRIRGYAYQNILGCSEIYGQKDEFDDVSDVIILRNGPVCVGGARITISTPKTYSQLPLENGKYNVQNFFPEIDFTKISYAEVSRVAMLPEFANGVHVLDLYEKLLKIKTELHNLEVIFFCTYPVHARKVQAGLRRNGFELINRSDIDAPHFQVHKNLHLEIYAFDTTPDKRHEAALKGNFVREVAVVPEEDLELA